MRLTHLMAALVTVGTVSLCGCNYRMAEPARLGQMIVSRETTCPQLPPALASTVALGIVTGGRTTNPLFITEVGYLEFRTALEESLKNCSFLAPIGMGSYRLDADLVGMDREGGGFSSFDFTVTSTVSYKLTLLSGGETRLTTTVVAAYKATLNDAFRGPDRIRLATERSMRDNIRRFLEQLVETSSAIPPSD